MTTTENQTQGRRPVTATAQAVFNADAVRFDKALREADAIYVISEDGGDLEFIDDTNAAPELLSAYRLFIEYGYANGLMP